MTAQRRLPRQPAEPRRPSRKGRAAAVLVTLGLCLLRPGAGMLHAGGVTLPDWDKVTVTARQVRGPVWYLEGFGGNIGVIADARGFVLVDDQYAPLAPKVKRALGAIAADRPVWFVINTHWHPDHTGGNERLGRAGAVVIAHFNTRRRLAEAMLDQAMPGLLRPSAAGLPLVTFSDQLRFHLAGETVTAFHIPPAHTDGDVVVRFEKSNVIHAGDAYLQGYYPYIDVDHGGTIDGLIAFWQRLADRLMDEDTIVIPGHGPPARRADVRRYLADMKTLRRRVAEAMAKGETLQALIARHPLRDLNPRYESTVVEESDILRMVYRSLAAKSKRRAH